MKNPKNPTHFFCEKCNHYAATKKDFEKHRLTKKHESVTNPNMILTKIHKNPQKFLCECGKKYAHRSTLSSHKKKCDYKIVKDEAKHNLMEGNLLEYLVKENTEFKEMLIEQNKMIMKVYEKEASTTGTICNINSHNKTFNLNVFLNEQCKDAMNITDFAESLQLQLSDLEEVGKLGFVEGISNIIIKNLKALDITKRPVHCSDSKRETMYIKDNNIWEKESEEKQKLRKVIKHVAYKNTKMLPLFRAKHPDCGKSESKYSDQYNKLIVESMGGGGRGGNDVEKENKIIKNIAKQVVIEK
jgi:hypothetical protein